MLSIETEKQEMKTHNDRREMYGLIDLEERYIKYGERFGANVTSQPKPYAEFITGVDNAEISTIANEYNLILQKRSKLSSNQRKIVTAKTLQLIKEGKINVFEPTNKIIEK